MARPHPKAVGQPIATTDRPGLCYLDSTDFSVAEDGKVSLLATSAAETYATDSGTVTPASSQITLAGGTGLDTSGSGSTATFTLEETFMRYTEVSLTNAEIKGLAASPKTLVAAPGAGKCIEFVSALLKLNAGSEALTETADNLQIKYTDASGVAVSGAIEATGFIDQTADTYTNALPAADQIVAATGCENQALVLDNTGDGEYGGNASNDATMTIGVAYRVHTL